MLMNDEAILREFHVSRTARDRYKFDQTFYATNGEVIFANLRAARIFAQRMNQQRNLAKNPEQAVRAGQLNALGLIHEISHHIVRWYRTTKNPNLLSNLLQGLNASLGVEAVEKTLHHFADEFPPLAVYRSEQTVAQYVSGDTGGTPNKELLLEELLLLWMSNINPAFAPFKELFSDGNLAQKTAYLQIAAFFPTFFESQPRVTLDDGVGVEGIMAAASARDRGVTLLDVLLAPMRAHPDSLEAQLNFIRARWGSVIGEYLFRLLGSLDMIHEEEKPVFGGGFGPPQVLIDDFSHTGEDVENFTQDREWMPRLVMIAKNAYVWLDQLSKKYDRPIRTLADIPDEELDTYARWGITGLWLIGLWERSEASRRIKQIMGNSDAVASAYSLYDYQIAQALGGEEACQNLRHRAWQRGIRLASDMVPNHVGIDGRWVVEHPDYFVQTDYPPFPSYTFSGPNLSNDGRVGIYLEDHYYTKNDASVVFKRVDHHSGHTTYIYHGNDGTSMPWNDTAQLNYLNPAVREAVIQTILHVARQFPIIRFDAAMTLAKKHYERLWFPEPGSGGDIASRADFAITKAEFDRLMPQEFWREVVDRAAVEAPDTLLLAEAFWLMESYFVRTLGMHRVYNSAFMHLLRDEDNAKYRTLMKNTLEFDPEILKRYVNFMNNPDEKTAVEQFGKGDKYFGILTLMITLPGLPMFGHGQIEGFGEKYGMEYQRAYWEEQVDQDLVARHEREIFPLMHKRYLFADVSDFLLYDFYSTDGHVNENVYAFSNRHGDERGLVIYHNAYASARGWVRTSAAYMARQGSDRSLTQKSVGQGLGLVGSDDHFVIFRDHVVGLEYIRPSRGIVEQGLYVELEAYKCHVFLDFREVLDDQNHTYRELNSLLNGRGVPSINEAIQEIYLRPVHAPLRELLNAELFGELAALLQDEQAEEAADAEWVDQVEELEVSSASFADEVDEELEQATDLREGALLDGESEIALWPTIERRTLALGQAICRFTGAAGDPQDVADAVLATLEEIVRQREVVASAVAPADMPVLWSWLFLHALGKLDTPEADGEQSLGMFDDLMLGMVLRNLFAQLGASEQTASRQALLVKRLVAEQVWFAQVADAPALLEHLFAEPDTHQLLQINRYNGVLWFSKECLDELLGWLGLLADLGGASDAHAALDELAESADASGYQVEKLLAVASA
ncbi:alpha-amylase [Chloroflexia bacterium SDU3-3]|nr:alpha-amylase [Chloroflexia bacterium SDU3-3]